MILRCILFTLTFCLFTDLTASTVLVADNVMSRMIELNAKAPYCKFHSDRGTIQRMLLASDQRRVRQMSNEAFHSLEDICRNNQVTSMHQGGFIYPGTKWCGPGTIATNYNDLGRHEAEDKCCREHDFCPMVLQSGECKQGICNTSPFTRSHCDCDARFRRCLQALNTEVGNTLGAVFFNVVQVTCFKERRPCSQWQSSQCFESHRSKMYVPRRPNVTNSLRSVHHIAKAVQNSIFKKFSIDIGAFFSSLISDLFHPFKRRNDS